ncbi:2-hydroxyacid dehydrogenase [Larsenimonas salina]|uniref:2-hydroxyacid dehydrogenase n=1 Tax=Larsenimonas salina TaxID=1295565 RepID=UPI00207476D4|nr:D-glycerate dehydrogenase [Larsenimonas salina]MCM5705672.1 D-glycerate dehydrogenase [Larsenimonas salina]
MADTTTPPEKKTVIVYKRPLAPDLMAQLEQRFTVLDFTGVTDLAEEADFLEALPRAHGLIGASVKLDRELLARAERLEAISSISVGVDNYDIAYLNERDIVLCHTPDVLTETTADTAFLLILSAARRGVELANMVRKGEWTESVKEPQFGVDVHHKTLGIVGMGRIGQAIGRRAKFGFGMTVNYHNRSRHEVVEQELDATWLEFETLLERSDIVCVTVPLSDATRKMFDQKAFEAMGAECIFVNISRGGVVDEPALIEALQNGTIRAAGLDVFETEPLSADSPLTRLDNAVTLPHIGSATHETRFAMAELAVQNLIQSLQGDRPQAPYNWDALDRG